MAVLSAWVFAALALVVAAFQLALAVGAPWGHLTNGGRWPGRLPMAMRLAAVAFAALWLGLAWYVLAQGGAVAGPKGPMWPVIGLCGVTMVLNLITPSRAERLIWGPVTVAMVLSVILVTFAAE